MRVVEVTVLGKPYELTFSNRVLMRIEKDKLDMDTTEGNLTLLSAMMEAGDKLARLEGREGRGFLTVDELADLLTPGDIIALGRAMQEAQTGDRNVEAVDDPKNAEETQPAE